VLGKCLAIPFRLGGNAFSTAVPSGVAGKVYKREELVGVQDSEVHTPQASIRARNSTPAAGCGATLEAESWKRYGE